MNVLARNEAINHDVTYELNLNEQRASRNFVVDVFRRFFDVVVSSLLIILLFIPMVVVAILVKCDSKGSVVFVQERLGLDGAPFKIYKFRTMYINSEINGPIWASKDDKRVTRMGNVLRKLKIDEVPQLFNIFLGQMSFIGPRPEREFFYNEFEKDVPNFRRRLSVKPGLTGLAQVNGGYDLSAKKKLEYDLEYIQSRSFLLDIKIVFKTFWVIIKQDGVR